jgi:serine/threonine protein kinase
VLARIISEFYGAGRAGPAGQSVTRVQAVIALRLARRGADVMIGAPTPMSTAAPTPTLPSRIGKYRVLNRLGEGATSEVFLCRDDFNERDVAIKRVRGDALADVSNGMLLARFFAAEAALVGRLHHPTWCRSTTPWPIRPSPMW